MGAAHYWNQGIDNVPWMTGASTLMDGADIREHAERLGFLLPVGGLLDVGCGTGRASQFAREYRGVDVSKDAVAYCQRAGLKASLIKGPKDVALLFFEPSLEIEWVFCLSVFTHIDRRERCDYLAAFRDHATNLLVDVIPGDGTGNVELWTAEWPPFLQDLADSGWQVVTHYDRQCPSGPTHRYVWARRA